MHRKDFLKTFGLLILGGFIIPGLSGCSTGRFINAQRNGNRVIIRRQDIKDDEDFVLTDTPFSTSPLIIVKENGGFIALLLKCTHLGCTLNVYPDKLICPCHGSEFNFQGEVIQHPADVNLTAFPTKWDEKFIYIYMKG